MQFFRIEEFRYTHLLLCQILFCQIITQQVSVIKEKSRRCLWCNGYRRRKWTRRHEFKTWTRLVHFHIALISLGKVWIQLLSLQLWVNSRADYILQPWWGNYSRRRKTLNSNLLKGDAPGVMVIVVGIGHGDTSSNPGLIAFHIALIPLGKVWIQLFSLQLWV